MFRIGIIGSDSSHASAFSKLANLPDENGSFLFPDVRVTHILGDTPLSAASVARDCRIPQVVEAVDEMYGKVDAVMILYRHGGLHCQSALPFLEQGIPVWIDKPVTIDPEECRTLIRLAKATNTLLAGGSTCRYCPDVLRLRNEFLRLRKDGTFVSGAFNFPGEIHSPYGGIYFYGGHGAEILTTIFGTDLRSIKADVHCDNLIALAKYDNFTVTVNFSEVPSFYAALYASSEVVWSGIDISGIYRIGFSRFVEALRRGAPLEPPENLLLPVRILNALERAIRDGEARL